ncbi:hypothetical protein A5784_34885 [Mycobacterium sp. 852013-50091_SCH5140682]|nr:hypothetical protein A5784_34885 [Mycobacterium sp. 852013-50091_SCH5140682]
MLEDDPADEIARTTTAAMERVGRDGKAEVDRQVQLLNGVREAWKLAPLAAKLGCNPSEIRDFTHAGFGLLMGSGVLGLIATYKDELAKVVAEFTEADKWGPNPPRPQIDLAFLPHQTNEEDSDDLETATQSPASSEGDEIEEDPPGSRPGVVKQLRSTELFGQFDAEMDELFARAARIDPALDMTAEVDQLRDTYARIRDTPIGNREYARAMLALLRRLQGSANPELAAGINSMIEEAEQYANSAHIAAGAASKVVRPAHWDDDDAVPDWENDASLAARDVPDEPKDDSQ